MRWRTEHYFPTVRLQILLHGDWYSGDWHNNLGEVVIVGAAMLCDVVALVRYDMVALVRYPGGATACLPANTTDRGDPIDNEDLALRYLLYLQQEVRC